jgi:hypothetical protein
VSGREHVYAHADVRTQLEFINDLKAQVHKALGSTDPAVQLDPLDVGNPWAYAGNYLDRIAIECVNGLQDKWSKRLGGYDAFIWDQCYGMEQNLTMD